VEGLDRCPVCGRLIALRGSYWDHVGSRDPLCRPTPPEPPPVLFPPKPAPEPRS
jgi:hypothetical protein